MNDFNASHGAFIGYCGTSIVHCSFLAVFYRRVGPGEFGPRFGVDMDTKWESEDWKKEKTEHEQNGRICTWEGRMLRDRKVMWLGGALRGKVWSTWRRRLLRPSRPSNSSWSSGPSSGSVVQGPIARGYARPRHRSSPSSLRIWCWARNLRPSWRSWCSCHVSRFFSLAQIGLDKTAISQKSFMSNCDKVKEQIFWSGHSAILFRYCHAKKGRRVLLWQVTWLSYRLQ